MKNNIIKTAALCILLTCLGHTAMQAQQTATLSQVLVEESYPANQPISIDLVVQAGHSTILPYALEFECTVGNKPPVVVSHPDTLLPYSTATITIHGLVFDKGSNFLEVVMKVNGWSPDIYYGNGSTWLVVQGIPFPGETLVEDFEGANLWNAAPGTVWEQGTPAGTQITAAHSGTKAWATVAAGNYPPSVTDYLYSPLFPYDSIGFTDTVLFTFHHFYALADTNDRAYVEYSIDSGATWSLLGTAGDPLGINWYGHPAATGFNAFYNTTQGWEYAAYKLPISLLGIRGVLQFRFVFNSDASGTADGWAIDDVTLKPYKPPYDAGITDVKYNSWKPHVPIALCWYHPLAAPYKYYEVMVKVNNFGSDTLTSIPVYFTNSMTNTAQEIWTGVLPPGDTVWYSFTSEYLKANLGSQLYTFSTMLGGDLNANNNGFQMPIHGFMCPVSVEEIPEYTLANALLVFPNPASAMLNFEMKESTENIHTIELYDIHGRLVSVSHHSTQTTALDISHLPGGIYLARVTVGQQVISRKVVRMW